MPVSAECEWVADDEIEDSGTSWVDGGVDKPVRVHGRRNEIATSIST